MAYGIGLVFDPRPEAHIREVWSRLATQVRSTYTSAIQVIENVAGRLQSVPGA